MINIYSKLVPLLRRLKVSHLILMLLGALYIFEACLILPNNHFNQVQDAIPDEIAFWETADRLKNLLSDFSFLKLLEFGAPYGYGFLFWLFSGFLLLLLPFNFSFQIVILRLIFLSFKYIAIYLASHCIKNINSTFYARIAIFILCTTPGLYFYGKIFSLEYLNVLLVVSGVYLLSKDNNLLNKNFFGAFCLILEAIFLKYINAPILLILVLYIFYNRKKASWAKLKIILGLFIILIITNMPFLFSRDGQTQFIAELRNSPGFLFSLDQFKTWLFFDITTWDQIMMGGWLIDFIAVLGLIIALIFNLIYTKQKFKEASLGIIILITGIVLATIISFSTTTHYWYLFIPYFLIVIGILGMLKNNTKLKALCFVLILITSIYSSSRIEERILFKLTTNKLLQENSSQSQAIEKIINKNCSNPYIISDVGIGLETSKIPEASIIFLRNFLTLNNINAQNGQQTLKNTDVILINKVLQTSNTDYFLNTFFSIEENAIGFRNTKFSKIADVQNISIYYNNRGKCVVH